MPDGWPRSSTRSTSSSAGQRTKSGRRRSATGACRRSRCEAQPARTRLFGGVRLQPDLPSQVSIPVLSAEEIERLLPMGDCIAVMEQAFADLHRGFLHHPLRTFWAPPGVNGGTMWMAAYRSSPKPMFGTKLLFVINDNPLRGLDSHQGQVILADGETGELRALLDASAVTAIRTAAVSALATRLLAREDAAVLAIVGTGVQARKHLA